jgi:hypothetical protein
MPSGSCRPTLHTIPYRGIGPGCVRTSRHRVKNG